MIAYNRRFGTRVMKKHPNIWTFIRIIQNENARFEHLIIQLDSGALPAEKTTQTTSFQRRLENLKARFNNNEINTRKLLDALTLLMVEIKIELKLIECIISIFLFIISFHMI